METRSRRKRCSSSGSNAERYAPVDKSRPNGGSVMSCETPRPNKRVRFSDPGPTTQNIPDYSTGLTPALCRTSFEEKEYALQRTPSRPSRRHSTPLPRSRRTTDSPIPAPSTSPERVLQFTPLRQILDARSQRRIRRIGLSNEITNLEREKRAAAQYERSLEFLLRERDSLKRELEVVKRDRTSPTSQSKNDDGEWMVPQDKIEHLESGNDQLRAQLSFTVREDNRQPTPSESGMDTMDTIMIHDSGFEGDTIFMSDSPDLRAADMNHSIPDDLLLGPEKSKVDSSVQTSRDLDSEFLALSRDLKAAEKEKRDLFEACRSRPDLLNGTALQHLLQERSHSPDFLDDIIPGLMQTLACASDAIRTLSDIQNELCGLGFHGASAFEGVQELRNRFRATRLELERLVPGETGNAGLNDGMSTLSALVKRVEVLIKDLGEEQVRHEGSADREKALRGQFDTLLSRYETASKKIQDLEESVASSAGDMLHTRMRMQELEREAQQQVIGIDRLNTALNKYHDEVKSLENLVAKLEDEKAQRTKTHTRQISVLEQKIADEKNARRTADTTITGMEKQIRELGEIIEQNKIRFCDLTAKVETIEREHSQAVERLEQNTAEHEQEIGLMNVRVAELNTALEAAKAEAEKLGRSNSGLEEQLRLELETRDGLLDRWVTEQTRAYTAMKDAVSSERRKAKVRAANWELRSDELQWDGMGLGNEPITPVSMTRFVDVEVGRGKHRRRLDSGIGILTEDELEDSVDVLPSDPADL